MTRSEDLVEEATKTAEAGKKSSFAWVIGSEIFAPLPPTTWRVPGLQLCPGRPSMLIAFGASGKTLASQALLLACATGKPVWGQFQVPAPMVTRHLDHEQGKHATQKRYQRLAKGMGLSEEEVTEMCLHSRLGFSNFPKTYLNSPGSESTYCREFEGVDLVILDALRGATPGIDENDSKIRDCIDQLARVSEKIGTTFWVLHHAGKGGLNSDDSDRRTYARGSSAIFDAAGSAFLLKGGVNEPKRMSHQKPPAEAEGAAVDDFYLSIRDTLDGGVSVDYQTVEQVEGVSTDVGAKIDETARRIESTLRDNPGITLRMLRATVKGGRELFDEAYERMTDDGRVVDRGTESRSKLFVISHEAH